jgi:hypothetical protein
VRPKNQICPCRCHFELQKNDFRVSGRHQATKLTPSKQDIRQLAQPRLTPWWILVSAGYFHFADSMIFYVKNGGRSRQPLQTAMEESNDKENRTHIAFGFYSHGDNSNGIIRG